MRSSDDRTKAEAPLVSVVIPTYNRATAVDGAIRSALNQTLDDIEVVVVDDGSTDDIESVVREYDDPRLRYVSHARNRGVSAARNTGIEAARAKYVAFLDSDDSWHPRKLELQVDCLESRSDEWVAAYCRISRQHHNVAGQIADFLSRRFFVRPASREGGEDLIREILAMNVTIGPGSTLLAERNVLEALNGFDENLDIHEDWDLLVRLLLRGKLAYVDEPLVVIEESDEFAADDYREAKRYYLAKLRPLLEQQGIDREVVSIHRLSLLGLYLMEGDFRAGRQYLSPRLLAKPEHLLRVVWWAGIGIARAVRRSRAP